MRRVKTQVIHVTDMSEFQEFSSSLLGRGWKLAGFSSYGDTFDDRNGYSEHETHYIGVFTKRGWK